MGIYKMFLIMSLPLFKGGRVDTNEYVACYQKCGLTFSLL